MFLPSASPYAVCVRVRLCLAATFAVALFATIIPRLATAQVAGQSVNMVTGTEWPGGDPFLERQNEPSMAVSSRNPLHLMAGNNDYRTVDLPGVDADEPTGDAWLGLFTSIDGGNMWQSVLVPGYPQDTSAAGLGSPLKGYNAAADATVRAGSNGLFYYSGLVFDRDSSKSAVFVARFVDDNNLQGSNAVRYLGESIVATGDANHFLDKPFIAVDIPRPGSPSCTLPAGPGAPAATISAGRIYVAYTQFSGGADSNVAAIMFSYSSDCGVTWTTPVKASGSAMTNQGAALAIDPSTGNVYIAWRVFKNGAANPLDAIAGAAFQYKSKNMTSVIGIPILPFDQGTTGVSFRTNAFPSLAVDGNGLLYVAWSGRGVFPDSKTGDDARITVIAGSPIYARDGSLSLIFFGLPVTVDPYEGRGHQIMPALAYSSGKLTVAWYDFRNDDKIAVYTVNPGGSYSSTQQLPQGVIPQFTNFVADPAAPYLPSVWRQTVDIRAAQAPPGLIPKFQPSILVSQYALGQPGPAGDPLTNPNLPSNPQNIQQLEFDAPNLPLFLKGTVPFVGDYIDVSGPTFVPVRTGSTQTWRFNNLAGDPDHTHVVWTDNRNVVQPADGNWKNFTPVASTGATSLFDPTQPSPACVVGQTGIRNQDIYTAALSSGLILSAKGNAKQLSTTLSREFPITVENPTTQSLSYRLTIVSQPTGGNASFTQYPVSGLANPLTQLFITVPPASSASRSVFILSSDPKATVPVNAVQTDANNNVVPNGLSSNVSLNSDVSNPNISNPNISNVETYNPNISNPNISNPNISNPNISNPNISNPNISNPNISNLNISNVAFANPNISNPNISNPNISNPNISNPNISNPNISNAGISGQITDASYSVTNGGNTAVSYAVNLVQLQQPPAGITVQLIVTGVYLTPVANACTLAVQPHFIPIANIPNPTFLAPGGVIATGPPSSSIPTFSLQPGEQALVTLRVYDPFTKDPAQALAAYNPVTNITPVISGQAVNTDLPRPPASVPILAISTVSLPAAILNANYASTLQAAGGQAPYTWSVSSGSLPSGLTLQSDGTLTGAAVAQGTYSISVQVSDGSGQTVQRSLTLIVASPAIVINAAALPTGKFEAPYSFTLTASGGTAPYHWTLAPNGVVAPGLSLNANTGVLSGAPAQAGLWSVPVMVSDSANPPITQTATLPLTIGLATAYAGGSNCYMPYPTTPLYYPGAVGWQLDASSLGSAAGQVSLLNGKILAGCLQAVTTGSYALNLTAVDSSQKLHPFTLPLPVIGQGTLDNGTVHFYSGGIGADPPPDGTQQGVAFSSQQFTAIGAESGLFGQDSTIAPDFLFGLSGGNPQVCTSDTSSAVSLIPPSSGRFEVLFNGTAQPCSSSPTFPNNPAPLAVYSIDVLNSPVVVSGTTITKVSVSPASGSPTSNYQQLPGVIEFQPSSVTSIPVTLTFNYIVDQTGCNGTDCIVQIQYGLNTDASPQGCAYNGIAASTGTSGSASLTLNVPNVGGRYYVAIDKSLQFSCTGGWNLGQPSAPQYIAIVDVEK